MIEQMIEQIIIAYLNSHNGIAYPAYGDTPMDGGTRYYLVQKTGSSNRNHINTAQVAIQSYGQSKTDAATMNETLVIVMRDLVTLPAVSACRLNSDYDYTDLSKRRYRYQAVFDITYAREG